MSSIHLFILIPLFYFSCFVAAAPAISCQQLFSIFDSAEASRAHVLNQRNWNTRYYGPQDSPGVHPGAYVDLKFDYWVVHKDDPRIKTFGDVSSVADRNGNIFLIGDMHFEAARQPWMHQKSSRILESVFGTKAGELTGHRHSSVRSATVELPTENRQAWVKLDGSYLLHVDKTLSMKDISQSREADDILKSSPLFLREPGAVLVENASGEIVPMILRQNPFSTIQELKEGSRLVTLHSLVANLKDYQPQAEFAGSSRNESPDRHWFKKSDHKKTIDAVVTAIADVVITSIFDFGVHLAPHGQNMEFLISKSGKIKKYWQKDLQEAKIDDELATHLRFKSRTAKYLKRFSGTLAEAEIKKWYEDYLRADQQDILNQSDEFNEIVKIKLIERFKIWVKSNREKYYIEKLNYKLDSILETPMEPWQVILQLRALVLQQGTPI